MKAEIVTRTSKKSGKDYTALQITIGEWNKIIFLDKYELLFVEKQIQNVENIIPITKKDNVDASLFD